MDSRGKRLYYIALVAFSLCSIIPILVFVYVLFEKGILSYTFAAVFTSLGLASAVVGYLFLRESSVVIARVARSLTQRAEDGDTESEPDQEIRGKVMEADEILEAFQKTVDRLEVSVDRIDSLSNQFVMMGELVHVASCSLNPDEMMSHFLKKIIHTTASEWGLVICMEAEDEFKTMVAIPEIEFSPGLHQQFRYNTSRVLKTKSPYLGNNFSSFRGSPHNGKIGPVVSWPAAIRGEVSAVLHLGRSHGSPPFGDDQFRSVRPAANLLGLALDNLRRLRNSKLFSTPVGEHMPVSIDERPVERPLVSRTIMVVDDELVVRNVLGNFLASKGYRVVTASSGEEAMMRIGRERIQIVLLDLNLQDMDGLELLSNLREEFPDTGVVVITAVEDVEAFKMAVEFGAFDYLVKPIDFNYLEKVLLFKMSRRENQ